MRCLTMFGWHNITMTHTYLLRRKRSLEVVGHEEVGRTGTCSVKNMTCSQFPMKANCKVDHQNLISTCYLYTMYISTQGIGVGRCGSNADLLKQLFTPHVVMVSSVSIIVIGNIIFFLSSGQV